ncbi:hypothetical protein LguiA_013615 [Lonicera macranthoides]
MGRRVQIKKIEDTTKRQVTFSKQRSSMMEKLKEISTCYNAEVAFIAFSLSGRDKLQKLRQLDPHIKGDISKLLTKASYAPSRSFDDDDGDD